MREPELYYRKPVEQFFQPRHATLQQPSGSIGEEMTQRIVSLFTSGRSIESITREVRRARHVVVHVLQSNGIYGKCPAGIPHEESNTCTALVEKSGEELFREVLKAERVDEPATPRFSRMSKSQNGPKSVKRRPKLAVAKKTSAAGRLSPQVLGALAEVVSYEEFSSDLSLEDVKN